MLLAICVVFGCGVNNAPPASTPTTASPALISIIPSAATLESGSHLQFHVSSNMVTDSYAVWLVNGVKGGTTDSGTISISGLYVAPVTTALFNARITAVSASWVATKWEANSDVVVYPPEIKPSGLDFYVATAGSDSNDGSMAKPWATIAHAASVVQPGAIVHVAVGKYSGSIITLLSGTANAPIRFMSDQRWGAQIIGTAAEATWQNRGDYIDIVGFDVTGAAPNGIENLGSYARILGNRVHDIVASCDSNGGSGINNANYSAHDNDIVGNIVYRVRASASCNAQHGVGIYHSNLRGHVSNNITFQNGTVGIQLWHAANNVVVANNTVFNNDLNGIVIGAGDSPGGVTNDYSDVVNNISFSNGYYGIQEFGSTGPHNRYLNNLMSQNPSGNLSLLTGTASGNIFASPQFVNYTGDTDGDYHLGSTSPATDAGATQSAPAGDFDGSPRPYGKGWDIGAFERGAPAGSWPWQ
jgi:hypothetical protein